MKLSVIIVNYNVRAYLEQCLRTVFTALEGIEGDVFVVDNLSTDGSVEMVREKFPAVRLIANKENVGFSRANNQAIKASDAEYVVLLNPDTVVGEDVFRKVIGFMDSQPKAGGLGVKMIDGTGHFLPESKRGLPTPAVAFFKIIGLTRLFPHSRKFGRYHLGHMEENAAAPIEILSGACMFLRKKTLNEVGLLDESFFMYGEDIDLSYRITLGGYENWYFPDARIIHYKGESTKKSSVNYVFVFYNAMAIFAQKHFTQRRTNLLSLLINGSIYLSAAGAIVMRFIRRALLPMLDLLLTMSLAYLVVISRNDGFTITNKGLTVFFLWTCAIAQSFLALFGGYDLPVRLINVLRAMGVLAVVAGVINVFTGAPMDTYVWMAEVIVCATACYSATRVLLHLLRVRSFSLRMLDRKRVLSIGSSEENKHALALLWQTHFGLGRQKQMSTTDAGSAGAVELIRKKIRKHDIDEVVFCAKDLAWGRIIELIEQLRNTEVMFKIAQPGREFIIGPNSIESIQDLDIMELHSVNSAAGRRTKRLMDVTTASVLLLAIPITVWFVHDRGGFIRNAWDVLRGRKSWVGYHQGPERALKLPGIKPGIIDPLLSMENVRDAWAVRANAAYAKDYSAWNDVVLLVKGFRSLGHA
ncbi:MAG: glycosyltransferase [Flavobacteriales bacterium]|nr:glycosyltransferase [Flavobacteriales bacterium]